MSDNPADSLRRGLRTPLVRRLVEFRGYSATGAAFSVDAIWPLIETAVEAARADERERLEKLRGDIHHNLNSAIGLMRWHLRDCEHLTYLEEHVISRMYAATDAADAALGEKPMREQLTDLKAQIAADRAGGV